MRALLTVIVLAAACGSKQPAARTSGTTIATPETRTPASAKRPASPYDAKVWIAKLDDPRESEHAVTQLEMLGDPSAIKSLGDTWSREGFPVRILQVIVSLARPLTAAEAKAQYMTDYEKSGRRASWDLALPFLLRAVIEVDAANPRSVDSATKAATALGEAKLGVDGLIELSLRPVTKRLIAAQIAAIRALGSFAGNADAVRALVRLISRDPPPHPRTATGSQARALEEKFGLALGVRGASINALAEHATADAARPLVLAMYRTPELFTQVRRALVASGPAAKAELQKALRGKHTEVNALFKAHKLDRYCGDRGDQTCQPISAMEFYAAVVLGDFYDASVVPDLLAVLKSAGRPPYYSDDQPAPNTQHNAVFDALRKIGSPHAAALLIGMWRGGKADLNTRILAIATYAFVARDTSGVDALGKIAADNGADDGLRIEAATAFARLSTETSDITLVERLAKRYLDASAKAAKEAAALQKDVDAADKRLVPARQAHESAKAELRNVIDDSASTTAQIKAATETAKQAEQDFKVAKKEHKEKTQPHKFADQRAKAYLGYARMFQTHIARIETAVRCKRDLDCYAATLRLTADDAERNNARYIKDLASWTPDQKRDLVVAAIDRAMLEIGKQGAKASAHTETLLDAVVSEDRLVRGSVLLALPKIASLPCASCRTKLDAAIKASEGKTTLGELNLEATILRNYFMWAGSK